MDMDLKYLNQVGSSKEFSLTVSYDRLVEAIGEPHLEDDPQKVDASWHVEDTNTGRRLAVWNYKNGPAYNTKNGPVRSITYWSACGSKELAEDLGLL